MSESDGIDDAIEGMSRVGLTFAGRLGEQLARAREQALRRAQASEEQQARELQARFDAERAATRAQLAPVMDNRWWDTASGRDVERVHEAATAWKDHDSAARSAAEVIRDQVQRRYGLDVDNLGADDASVAAALANAERDREQAEQERTPPNAALATAPGRSPKARKTRGQRTDNAPAEGSKPLGLQREADRGRHHW
ncbi:hypothetical protein ACFUOZ_20540 [Paenarthrobacter sp. NPDC057355]|uniref:hypothetical protein n=1 Tax=Paenarthrobacter sp. NPDC057355 TaxID=3346105 RepID=UPI003641DF60